MTKPTAHDRYTLYAISATLIVLIVGFLFARHYMEQREAKLSSEITYLGFSSIAISRNGHSMAATCAVRTSGADAEWAKANKMALEQIMKSTLLEADPVKSRGPAGLQALQNTMRDAINTALHTSKVQEVVITDFLVSEGDL